LGNHANLDAAMARAAALYDVLVIHAGNEVWPETARIDLLQGQFLARRDGWRTPRPRIVNCLPVASSRQGDIIRIFVAAFDFQSATSRINDLRDMVQCGKTPRRKEIARVAERLRRPVNEHFIRQPAGLRTLAAIGASPAPGL